MAAVRIIILGYVFIVRDNMEKITITIQGVTSLLFIQFFSADTLPLAEFSIKLVVAAFTCYALYKQTKKTKK